MSVCVLCLCLCPFLHIFLKITSLHRLNVKSINTKRFLRGKIWKFIGLWLRNFGSEMVKNCCVENTYFFLYSPLTGDGSRSEGASRSTPLPLTFCSPFSCFQRLKWCVKKKRGRWFLSALQTKLPFLTTSMHFC